MCFTGFGSGVTLITSSSAVMAHYHHHNTGTSLGWLGSANSLLPLSFIFIYNQFFINGHYEDPINQDLGGFLVLIATSFGVLNLCGLFLYFPPQVNTKNNSDSGYKDFANYEFDENGELSEEKLPIWSNAYTDDEKLSLTNGLIDSNKGKGDCQEFGTDAKLNIYHSNTSPESSSNELPKVNYCTKFDLCQLFLRGNFWCISLSFMIMTGITEMHVNNLTTYLAAFGLDAYAATIPYINPVIGFIYKPIAGMLSDKLEHYIPKPWYLIGASFSLSILSILAIFYLDKVGFVVSFYVIVDTIISTYQVLTPDLIIANFGIASFPTTYGFCVALQGFSLLLFQFLFGLTYDSQVLDDNTTSCYGLECFTNSLVMSTVVCVVSVLLCIYLLKDFYSFLKCCMCREKKHQLLEQ